MIPVRGFEGKRVAVFGLARTGLTAAHALLAGGAEVALWDERPAGREAALAEGLPLVDLGAADWSQFAALMLSPGVPLTHPTPHWTVEKAKAAGVEILGDVELFARTVNLAPEGKRPRIIAITGTNGKSTTTALIGHLSPDHLDRHGGMEGYVAAKRRILLNQGKGDTAVIGVDDPWGQRICTEITAANRRTIVPISASKAMGRGVYALQGVLYDATGERAVEVVDLLEARSLPGRHNWQNAAAAFAACRGLGILTEEVAGGLMSFPGLAHRMETVAHLGDIRFVNDSKATNTDAARQAMSSYPKFYWIAGGQPKTGGIDSLSDLFPRIETAYLIGEASAAFAETLKGKARTLECGTMEAAVAAAHADALAAGGPAVILLSPACASFDQFADFEARGEAFRAAVLALGETTQSAPQRRAFP